MSANIYQSFQNSDSHPLIKKHSIMHSIAVNLVDICRFAQQGEYDFFYFLLFVSLFQQLINCLTISSVYSSSLFDLIKLIRVSPCSAFCVSITTTKTYLYFVCNFYLIPHMCSTHTRYSMESYNLEIKIFFVSFV